ncbi:SusC/RagA family TonB-linked outer membrane protein [Chitinophaga solisilvae]|uniref:SusC/RagA family TonB-linked outer membrane protein n=1 Tax=Chitinophaga solisilvae TaxID=1233460 RepID=UPI001370F96F|nr:SusC/RagA family TonB-linked outer membrane protein [Chitinophaga solisilvae]
MKLTLLLLTAVFLQVSATSEAQPITFSGKNVPMEKVFSVIREQTGFLVVYNVALLKDIRKVSVDAHNMQLETFLELTFREQPLKYVIRNNTILVTEKPRPSQLSGDGEQQLAAAPPAVLKGMVVNEKGEPLPGVTILLKGSSRGAVTDNEGAFSFTAGAEGDAVLIVQMIGYIRQEIAVNGRSHLQITLRADVHNLENVTISTGYKKIPKYQLTGAASLVTQKEYDQRVAVTGNFLESLEGKVPGLVYNSQSGELSIRGVSTFDAVKKPLIVVDGFPTEIDLNTINPIDIVSISVLRDAAAAAIYGVRASNGVIVVETKRGKSGKARLSMRATTAFQESPDFGYLRFAGAQEFVSLQEAVFRRTKPDESAYIAYGRPMSPATAILFDEQQKRITPAAARQKLDSLGGSDNTQEYKNLFYRTRMASNVNLDISGGNERSTYLLGVNYIAEQPVNNRSKNNQLILNIANTYQLSKRLKMDFRGVYAHAVSENGTTAPLTDFYPYEKLADANGIPLAVAQGTNREYLNFGVSRLRNNRLLAVGLYDQLYYPYRELTANTTKTKTNTFRAQARVEGKINEWMSAEAGGNYELQQGVQNNLLDEQSYTVRKLLNLKATKGPDGRALFIDIPQGNILRRTDQKVLNYTLRAQLNFDNRSARSLHEVSGILGAEQRKTTGESYLNSYFGYDPQSLLSRPVNMQRATLYGNAAFPDVTQFGGGMTLTEYLNETSSDRRFLSWYAQGTYIYNSKYIVTGSYRIDQSNLFGVDPKYKFRPLWSAGGAWRLHMENFLKDVSWISELKLNATTGFNGNVPVSNNGAFLILASQLNNMFEVSQPSNYVITPENQSLRWETTQTYNLRLDYGFFNNRLFGSLDYYHKKTKDVFGQYDADPTSGFNQYNANTATIRNSGIDLLISSVNLRNRRFEWRTSLTASLNNNKVLAVKAGEYKTSEDITSSRINRQGYPMDAIFSYNYGGLTDKGKPFVYDTKGGRHILDFYGNAVVDVAFEDLIYNGTTTPKYVLGLNNQFSIGDFDLSFLFMYYGGHIMRVEPPNPANLGSYGTMLLKGSSDYWKQPGDELRTNIPGIAPGTLQDPYYFPSYARYGYRYASQFVRRADYIRLRDLIITYNPKFNFIRRMGLSQTQLRLQGQNLFYYTFSGNDIDPDAIDRVSGVRRLPQRPLYSISLFTNF